MKKLSKKHRTLIEDEWKRSKTSGNGQLNPYYPPNEFIFADYIKKQKVETIRTDWVRWMLRMLYEARREKKVFNVEFINNHPEAKKEPLMA